MIHFEIDSALFGVDEARRNLIAKDPQAQFALAQFAEAVHLTELARDQVDADAKAATEQYGRAFGPTFCGCTLVLPQVWGLVRLTAVRRAQGPSRFGRGVGAAARSFVSHVDSRNSTRRRSEPSRFRVRTVVRDRGAAVRVVPGSMGRD